MSSEIVATSVPVCDVIEEKWKLVTRDGVALKGICVVKCGPKIKNLFKKTEKTLICVRRLQIELAVFRRVRRVASVSKTSRLDRQKDR